MRPARIALCASILIASALPPPAPAAASRAPQSSAADIWTRGRLTEIEGLWVGRVEFVGNETPPHAVVDRALLLVEGDAFSYAQLKRGLRRLNALGLFYRVTEGDVEWRRDTRSGDVDFTINLRERPRRNKR